MDRSFAGDDSNRLPWLADELPKRRARRPLKRLPLGVLAVPGVLLALGAAYFLGAATAQTKGDAIAQAPRAPLTIKWESGPFDEIVGEPIPIEPEPVAAQSAAPPVAVPAMAARLPQAPAAEVVQGEAAALAAAAPEKDSSFSCRLAQSPSLMAICRNEDLLKLDQHLSLFYTQAFTRADASKRELLLNTREAFARWREACQSESCIRGVYSARIREVSGIMAGHIQAPASTARARQSAVAARAPRADASFSCRLAKTSSQIAVCTNDDLLKLDQHLSLFYTQAFTRADASKRKTLLRTRESFAAARDQCQSDECLRTAYLGRIQEVASIVAGGEAKAAQ